MFYRATPVIFLLQYQMSKMIAGQMEYVSMTRWIFLARSLVPSCPFRKAIKEKESFFHFLKVLKQTSKSSNLQFYSKLPGIHEDNWASTS